MDNSNLMSRLMDERGIEHHVLRDDEECGGSWRIVYKYQGMWQDMQPKSLLGDQHWLDEPTKEELVEAYNG